LGNQYRVIQFTLNYFFNILIGAQLVRMLLITRDTPPKDNPLEVMFDNKFLPGFVQAPRQFITLIFTRYGNIYPVKIFTSFAVVTDIAIVRNRIKIMRTRCDMP
jgi:hypothetical protein